MRPVLLSADSPWSVYLVPDPVAEQLEDFCMEFCSDWLWKSPDAARYRGEGGVCYDERDFIEYLNTFRFPQEPARLVETPPEARDLSQVPARWRRYPHFAV